jgi:predicted nucleic acid-binding protein
MKTLILDTNIVFSALRRKNTSLRDKLTNKNYLFYTPRFLFVEIFKHKERILKGSRASEEETLELLSIILHHLNFINEDLISTSIYMQAYKLCKDIDEKDTPFIAMAIAMNCPLWTRDEELKIGLRGKGFQMFIDENDL